MASRTMHLMARIESARGVEVPASLHWHDFAPFAVVMIVSVGNNVVRTWEFAIDLLADALANPGDGFGLGDVVVRVARASVDESQWRLHVALSPPGGFAALSFPVDAMRKFVTSIPETDTDRAVSDHLDWLLEDLRGEVQP
jgi:hypothetical protein